MIAVRTNNLIADMAARNRGILSAVFTTNRTPTSRPSTIPVETRRQAIVSRSAPGPVLEVMLKNWPIDRMVKEIVELRAAQVKAANDHDDVALEVVDREYAKLAGLAEQHDLRDAGFSKRMWERVDELTTKAEIDKVSPDVFHVVHGSFEPGTLGAELAPELRLALFELTQPPVEVPQAEAAPTPAPLDDADEVVRKAMEELANNQQSTI
jgi:hypothetical protein